MEHLYPGVLEPVQQVIGNLLAFPSAVFSEAAEKKQEKRQSLHTRLDLQEKEEELQRLQSALTARTAELQKKEAELSERWDTGRIYSLPIKSIAVNPHQPRREFEDLSLFSLANSIRTHGILQPLTVRRMPAPHPEENAPAGDIPQTEAYQLITGERRLRAAAAISMETVPCIILEADNRRSAELALIENLQRENLNLFEQAGAIAALIDMHAMTQEEIARSLSVSQSCVANKLRILRLTNEEREIILTSHLTERHARAFLRIKDLELRKNTVRLTAENSFNVAQTEQYIDDLLTVNETPQNTSRQKTHHDTSVYSTVQSTAKRKGILRDLRLIFNTIDRAVTAAREAGFSADCTKQENGDTVTLTVSIKGISAPAQNDASHQNSAENVSRETASSS